MSTSFFQTELVKYASITGFFAKDLCNPIFFSQALLNVNVYFITVLNCLITSSANLYLFCFAGCVATDNLIKFADALFESNWFRMPNHLQKYFIIMIAEAQKPFYFEGFGLVRLSLEAFTKVLEIEIVFRNLFT